MTLFAGKLSSEMTIEERVKMLDAVYDGRQSAERTFWSEWAWRKQALFHPEGWVLVNVVEGR